MHIPVLLNEVIEYLNPKEGEFFIDGTVGGGGHSASILEKIGTAGRLLAIDLDITAIERLKIEAKFQIRNSKFQILCINGNYADLSEILKNKNLPKADGLIVDLGFSSDQIESSKRGFSFLRDEPLDMRYAQVQSPKSKFQSLTAAEVINSFKENELADIFYKYGEERMSRRIAAAIARARKIKKIMTTFELNEIIKSSVPKNYERGRVHPSTRVFQSLRIFINHELENLEKLLMGVCNGEILKAGGRMAVISFHSLEDRIVKNYFKNMAKENKAEILTKKPIIANEQEIKNNPRSRSAKMRAVEIVTRV